MRAGSAHSPTMAFPIRVVIVDDLRDDTGTVVETCLRGEGRERYEVALLRRADEALLFAEATLPPVVLFLCGMQHLAHICEPIARACSSHSIGVVLATCVASERVPQVPGFVVLRKPFTIEELMDAIADAAPSSAPTNAHAA
jgi:hypothetical protein